MGFVEELDDITFASVGDRGQWLCTKDIPTCGNVLNADLMEGSPRTTFREIGHRVKGLSSGLSHLHLAYPQATQAAATLALAFFLIRAIRRLTDWLIASPPPSPPPQSPASLLSLSLSGL